MCKSCPKIRLRFGLFWQTSNFKQNYCDNSLGNCWKNLGFLFEHLVTHTQLVMNDSVQMFNGQFPISLSWRINKNWTLVSNGTVAADRCDQMATIFFQYLAILTMKICQIAQNICQHWFTIWQNTQYPPPELKIAKDFQNVAKVAKFRQIWSLRFWHSTTWVRIHPWAYLIAHSHTLKCT